VNRETAVKNSILIALGSRPDVMIWNNPTGVFRAYDSFDRIIKVGLPGQPDVLAVVNIEITPEMVGKSIGAFVGLEIKTPKTNTNTAGRQSEKQKNWQAAFEKKGGKYAVIRSPNEAISFINSIKVL